MSMDQDILKKVSSLPVDKQQEVLDFVEFLQQKVGAQARQPYKNLMGALERPGISITEEDIAEARREMWGNFPRDI